MADTQSAGVTRALQLRNEGKTLPAAIAILAQEGFQPRRQANKLMLLDTAVTSTDSVILQLKSKSVDRKTLGDRLINESHGIGTTNTLRTIDWETGQVIR